MRLLNSIHDEIGNRSFACWFASICRLKSPYKPTVQRVCTRLIVGKRFTVCSGAKNTCIQLARHRNYRQVLNSRLRYRRKTKNRVPPKHYRRIAFPPNNYRRIVLPPKRFRHILVYRFRQSRCRQKRENRQPPKNYRRIAIPPRLCPTKKPLLMTTLHK